MLTSDSPELDPRLSQLRRASQLSAKASLFVLTPVPAEQLPEFVQSLQDALYDSAMDYYGNLTKRVRRKRARTTDLRWEIRYDWKAGWFAELRGDDATRWVCSSNHAETDITRIVGTSWPDYFRRHKPCLHVRNGGLKPKSLPIA